MSGYGVKLATISHQSMKVRLINLSYNSLESPTNSTTPIAVAKAAHSE